MNYTIPTSGKSTLIDNQNADTSSNYLFSPVGKIGAMLEGGAFMMYDNPIVSFADAGIRVNWFNGKEKFTDNSVLTSTGDTLLSQEGYRDFTKLNASLRLNANNTIQVSKYGFIQNTLGLNMDYFFYQNTTSDLPIFPIEEENNYFQMQIHYKLAYGFRLDLMHYMIIGLDTPILTLVDWDGGSSKLPQPLILLTSH